MGVNASQGSRNSPSLGSWFEIVTVAFPSLFCDGSGSVEVVPGRLNVIGEENFRDVDSYGAFHLT